MVSIVLDFPGITPPTVSVSEFVSHVNFGAVMLNEKNPMVEKLKVILLKEFSERPDFRALVFVCTRELTIALMECMNEDPDLRQLGACRLTGVQASKQKGGKKKTLWLIFVLC